MVHTHVGTLRANYQMGPVACSGATTRLFGEETDAIGQSAKLVRRRLVGSASTEL